MHILFTRAQVKHHTPPYTTCTPLTLFCTRCLLFVVVLVAVVVVDVVVVVRCCCCCTRSRTRAQRIFNFIDGGAEGGVAAPTAEKSGANGGTRAE
jgi:hypothetical protein